MEALRTAARVLDPDAAIRVEFVDAEDGSLRINTILEWVEKQLTRIEEGQSKYPRLRKLAIALIIFIPLTGVPTYLDLFGGDETVQLSDEDREILLELLERVREIPEIEATQRRFFKILERDPTISGVGVGEHPDDPLAILVPSSEFSAMSGLWVLEHDEQTRTIYPVVDVTLIAPVLVSRPRSWTFQPEGLPEFSATMKDKRLLAALDNEGVREYLRSGIKMTLRLEVKEEKIDGDWRVRRQGRSVIEVITPKID